MGRSCGIVVEEKVNIRALVKKRWSYSAIANNIGKRKTGVGSYVRHWRSDARARKGGRRKQLSHCAVWVVVGTARQPGMTSRRVLEETGVRVSLRTVQMRLAEDRNLRFGPATKASALD